jgi:hypothetical protein
MKGLFGACATVATVMVLAPGLAGAQDIIAQRCTIDSLDSAQAEARLIWARRCALVTHIMSPANYFDTGVPASNGGTLLDYREYDSNLSGQNSYSARNDGYEVNSCFVNKLYLSGGTFQDVDPDGYFRWSRLASRKKARPLYPTFSNMADVTHPDNKMLFPHPTLANCTLYLDRNGTQPASVYGYNTYFINGYCEASCYTPEQRVLFSDGYEPILDALNARREDLITLTPDSSLDNVKLQQGHIYNYTAEIRDAEHPIVEIRTASGGQLRVTVEHPVITGEGRLVAAQSLKVGNELVKADGTLDPIVSVTRTRYYGKVYNLRPASTNRVSNVLVAEGYLVGSSLFQNDEVGYINRMILYRNGTPDSHIP